MVSTTGVKLRVKVLAELNGRSTEFIRELIKRILATNSYFPLDGRIEPHVSPSQTDFEDEIVEFCFELNSDVLKPVKTADLQVYERKYEEFEASFSNYITMLMWDWCHETAFGFENQVCMAFEGSEPWCRTCYPAHYCMGNIEDVPIRGFAFGNLLSLGVFTQGYAYPPTEQMNRCYGDGREPNHTERQLKPDPLSPGISGVFEHDRRFLILEFAMRDADDNQIGYKIELNYKSIHRLVVDMSGIDSEGDVLLFFSLKYPPKVFRATKRNDNRPINGRRPPGATQFGQYHRDLTFGNCPEEDICQSSCLKLWMSRHPIPNSNNNEGSDMSDVYSRQIWEIISRIRARAKCDVLVAPVRSTPHDPLDVDVWSYNYGPFACQYAMASLLSRGWRVTDQICDSFCNQVAFRCTQGGAREAQYALENLVSAVDEHRNISLLVAFEKLYENALMGDQVVDPSQDAEAPTNCAKVRKVIVTPTRLMFLSPEVMMSNRVIRRFGAEYAMRVLFRDDNQTKIHAHEFTKTIFDRIVEKTLTEGITVGNPTGVHRQYQFLAWSNSQLRDVGCYMFAKTDKGETVETIKSWMGDFSNIKNVPKLMARMGQCFTQTQVAMVIPLASDMIKLADDDITGGAVDAGSVDGSKYVFSDGIGRISGSKADEISKTLGLDPTPSAFQIRYAGNKGMLTVDTRLDNPRNPVKHQIIFRKSMDKFPLNMDEMSESPALEIVKWSQPSQVTLNRPLIMILDQMTHKGGVEMHKTLKRRVHELLEYQLFEMADMLLNEKSSATALENRTNMTIKFQELLRAGICFTNEPFFRSLLLAIHKQNIQTLYKCKIEIPWCDGRTLYGVLDETGIVQYGQVFIQISEDPRNPKLGTKILKGPVMITKNPSIVPGDVRMLKAVGNITALSHLVDVVVFPRNGPRPHTDEMAGSDLDGDEYAVFWDERLFLPNNSNAMTFQKLKPQDLDHPIQVKDMVNFFKQYIDQDSVGMVATAHLVAADKCGIESAICMSIAEKQTLAVDFPKTGIPPPPLDDDERVKSYPDFLNKEWKLTYRSKRLLGQLHRKIKKIEDIIQVSQSQAPRIVDPDLKFEGWEDFITSAIQSRDHYNNQIQRLLDQYGVRSEAELVSGHMAAVKNRLSDGEKEDFSFYNTEKMVELRLKKIWDKTRAEFFRDWSDDPSIFDFAEDDSNLVPPMMSKASAWYQAAYDPEHGNHRFLLSFPWIVWDILKQIKRQKTYGSADVFGDQTTIKLDPITHKLFDEMKRRTGSANVNQLQYKQARDEWKKAQDECEALRDACRLNPEFDGVQLVLINWALQEKALEPGKLLTVHLCLIFFHFLTEVSLTKIQLGQNISPEARVAEYLLQFVRYLASEEFNNSPPLQFPNFDPRYTLRPEMYLHLHLVAFKTYHRLALSGLFESLYLTEKPQVQDWDMDELEPIKVEAERICNLDGADVRRLLIEWSGCQDVRIRRRKEGRYEHFWVSGYGKLEARQKLRQVLQREDLHYCLVNRRCAIDESDV